MEVGDEEAFVERQYRCLVNPGTLVSFRLKEGESDILVSAGSDLRKKAMLLLAETRKVLHDFISERPAFADSLEPLDISTAPDLVLEMSAAAHICGVGPMASVAGAVAQALGRGLRPFSPELVIENGGDIYLCGEKERTVAVYAGDSGLSGKLGLRLSPGGGELGVCTSSASVGPSLSMGKADAAVAVAETAVLADALATALGNKVRRRQDIRASLDWARGLAGVKGGLVILGSDFGACGEIEVVEL